MDILTLRSILDKSKNNISLVFIESIFKMFETLNSHADIIAENRYRLFCHGRLFVCSIIKTRSGNFLKVSIGGTL